MNPRAATHLPDLALVWLRRDLRLEDNTALSEASHRHARVAIVFCFDTTILNPLDPTDRRISFIHACLTELEGELRTRWKSRLIVLHGNPTTEIPRLADALQASAVYANEDYEPSAKKRDTAVQARLEADGKRLHLFTDQVILPGKSVLSQSGGVFKVFTPYKNAWLKTLAQLPYLLDERRMSPRTQFCKYSELDSARQAPSLEHQTLENLGFVFQPAVIQAGSRAAHQSLSRFLPRLSGYTQARDFPAHPGSTSELSPHFRFGTLSIREAFRASGGIKPSSTGAATWQSELIWREFYQMILDQFPRVAAGGCFKPEYDSLKWPGKIEHFEAWCEGRTGFPLIDAAMRHFSKTGWMHNRLRMVVASFLCKDLLIDWRRGEQFFAKHLLDFDLASNSGGWQWSASVGCDAQPYFRVFNPTSQSEKFDPNGAYIREHIPELAGLSNKEIHAPPTQNSLFGGSSSYPPPLVNHSEQRLKAIELFKR